MDTTTLKQETAQRRKLARKKRAEQNISRAQLMIDFPHYFTLDEVAVYLRKSRKFVEKLVYEGKLDGVDVGQGSTHSWLVPFESVLQFTGHIPLNLSEIGELILNNGQLMDIIIRAVSERILGKVFGAMNQALSDRLLNMHNWEDQS